MRDTKLVPDEKSNTAQHGSFTNLFRFSILVNENRNHVASEYNSALCWLIGNRISYLMSQTITKMYNNDNYNNEIGTNLSQNCPFVHTRPI
jgi:hypothetical protein